MLFLCLLIGSVSGVVVTRTGTSNAVAIPIGELDKGRCNQQDSLCPCLSDRTVHLFVTSKQCR
jgi:hypothetical protein